MIDIIRSCPRAPSARVSVDISMGAEAAQCMRAPAHANHLLFLIHAHSIASRKRDRWSRTSATTLPATYAQPRRLPSGAVRLPSNTQTAPSAVRVPSGLARRSRRSDGMEQHATTALPSASEETFAAAGGARASAEARSTYPMFPESAWWPLRERFKQSMPSAVSPEYLRSVLGVEAKTARNLYATLKTLGILDREGIPSRRANRWRVDQEYPDVCRELIDELYPARLAVETPDASRDLRGAVAWFMREAEVGEPAARRMARFHQMLLHATPRRGHDAGEHATPRATRPTHTVTAERHASSSPAAASTFDLASEGARGASTADIDDTASRDRDAGRLRIALADEPVSSSRTAAPTSSPAPAPHRSSPPATDEPPTAELAPRVDVHLHFTPEMSERQIDVIFRSMAAHLFGRPRA